MRLSIVIPVPNNGALNPIETSLQKVSQLGYDAVELSIRDPKRIDSDRLLEMLSANNLKLSCVITGRAFTVDGLSLVDRSPKTRRLAIQRLKDYISFASVFTTVILVGWMRGSWSHNRIRSRKLFIDGLTACGRFALDKRVLLGIEAINRYEVDSVHTLREALSTAQETSLPNVGVVADTFHMNIEESRPIHESIRECNDRLFHVHVADSNRKIPGEGHLPFKEFLSSLREMRYDRFVSVEIIPPLPDFDSIATKSARYLQGML
jgi:sugar phosphate isomerase/epimerase